MTFENPRGLVYGAPLGLESGSPGAEMSMLDKFSDKSLKAVESAKQLAEQLEDGSVATGHLVFGLCEDTSVRLHHIFKDLNIDPDMFSGYVDSLPREPSMGEDQEPFNRHVRTVFERARECADEFGDSVVDPEHLAIALMSVRAGSCYETLKEFSIDPTYVQGLILESMGREPQDAPDWF